MTLRVRPDGHYTLDGERGPVRIDRLADHLRARVPARSEQRTLRVLGYEGVTGYDIVLALDAAREAGFTRAEGIADYKDGGSVLSNYKRWEQDLSAGPAHATTAADTARRPH